MVSVKDLASIRRCEEGAERESGKPGSGNLSEAGRAERVLSLQQHQVHAQQAPQERRGQELLVDVFARPSGAIIAQGRGEVESAGARSDTRASG